MSYPFDEELAPWVPMLPDISLDDIESARRAMGQMLAALPAFVPPAGLRIEDRAIPGPEGAPEISVRLYRPVSSVGRAAAMVYVHGGGFVLGDLDMVDADAATIASETGAVVVSVDYRLAPEHPFPAGLEDCYAALCWTVEHADDLGVDPRRVAVGGESAGGGLSAAVALLSRDRGGPQPCFQYLGIPELDDRLDTPSMRRFVDTPLWHRPNAVLSWTYYLGRTPGGADVSPYAAPARAEDLSALPPAYIATCEFDPLRDEGLAYGQRLLEAGVSTEIHHYPGTFHGSAFVADAAVSRRMSADKLAALRRALGGLAGSPAGAGEPI